MTLDTELARSLLAGWVAGAAIGLATTAIAVIAFARDRRLQSWAAGRAGTRVSTPLIALLAVNAMTLAWTLLGLVLGALYHASGGPPVALGVPAAVLAAVAAAAVVRGRLTWPIWATGVAAALGFGGLLPLLAR